MAGFIAFLMIPLIQSFLMVFSRVEINAVKQQYSMTFTGLDNLRRVFLIDPDFTRLLSEEILRMVLIVPAILIFSLFIAVLLNQHFPGRGLVRAIFFLPVIFSSGIIVQLELNSTLLNSMAGIYQEANTAKYSVSFFIQDIFSGIGNNNAFASFSDYIFDIVDQIQLIVMSSGIQIIIFLSALQSIPPSMFEAAEMEGSTKWESFWKISFPMVSPLIVVNIVYSVVDYFLRTDNELMMRIRRILMQNMEYGYYSAMAWVYFLAVILILGIVNLLISRRVYYYD
ncbi:MAG: sugar ABC transporter permease [Treponema sp.]|jgi:ABC-type sugar transport system permease subunit|nr:sugar ABC transporter permease [Treponema sp.]